MRFRFYDDAAERMMDAAALNEGVELVWDDHGCATDNPDLIDLALQLRATMEPDPPKPHSSTGVDGFQDLAAYGARSRAELMPGYVPPTETTFFGVKRRSTKGQPL